ncbi:MAG: 2-hydroxymuconic semialdehyde dehydrogenase [Gemmatimonadetes bacterium]|nr:2-hydroxymuconic semialdehyde dehydrogenase [Gemmatimonadota bacterium]
MNRVLNTINGRQVEPAGGQWLENIEPATGQAYGQIADSTADDVQQAVEAAEAAFPGWSSMEASHRSDCMHSLADALEANLDELARLETIDNGKPISLSTAMDIPRAVSNLRFFAEAALADRSEEYETGDAALNTVLRQPVGVVGLISPWNLPLYLFTWKIAPALAAGNTIVAKPSELTPVTAARLGELSIEAGFPPGVLNIIHGTGPAAGEAIVSHPGIKAISFTGGTETGAKIAETAAPHFKKLSLELGGKNPNILFEDADLELAMATSLRSSFANQGQICLCGSRMLVHRSIQERVVESIVEGARNLKIVDPLDPATQQGALISASHRDKVAFCVERAREEGGKVLCGGRPPAELPERCEQGFFYEPTVITGLDMDAMTNTEEIFGPVVTIIPFDDEEEAISMANATRYGLSASVWTTDEARAVRVSDRIEAGTVWVNCWLLRDLRVPFGGVKHSGVGREGGEEAMRFFTEPKTICQARSAT